MLNTFDRQSYTLFRIVSDNCSSKFIDLPKSNKFSEIKFIIKVNLVNN